MSTNKAAPSALRVFAQECAIGAIRPEELQQRAREALQAAPAAAQPERTESVPLAELPPLPEPSAHEVIVYGRREKLVTRADVADEIACKYRESDPAADFRGLFTASQMRAYARAAQSLSSGEPAWHDRQGARSNRPQLCRFGTPYESWPAQPCDCPPGACRLGRASPDKLDAAMSGKEQE